MKGHIRHQFSLPPTLSARLDALASKPGATKSSILAGALENWLDRSAAHALDERYSLRLDRMSRSLDRIERNSQVIVESLALFIHYELAIQPQLDENDQAGRALAARRFSAFVAQVGRQIATGRNSLDAARAMDVRP